MSLWMVARMLMMMIIANWRVTYLWRGKAWEVLYPANCIGRKQSGSLHLLATHNAIGGSRGEALNTFQWILYWTLYHLATHNAIGGSKGRYFSVNTTLNTTSSGKSQCNWWRGEELNTTLDCIVFFVFFFYIALHWQKNIECISFQSNPFPIL